MGSNMNFKNFGNEPPGGGGGNSPSGNMPLTRQPSVYSLTFDEFQSTMGGVGKDFGSMNMDELLKNIWTAEEMQAMATSSAAAAGGGGAGSGGGAGGVIGQEGLQRQGSLTLPRTLSQKTVDEVWRDISKEYGVGKDGNSTGGSNKPQRQQTLGEITLEEFLVRAGVVREEVQFTANVNNGGFFEELSRQGNNTGLGIGFQQSGGGSNLLGNRVQESNNQMNIQASNMPLNVNGVRNSQQQQHVQHHQPQQQIFPKQPGFGYATQMSLQGNAQIGSPGMRGAMVGVGDHGITATGLVQSSALQGGGMGVVGLGGGGVGIPSGSPATPLSSDGIGKSNGDTSSVSPVPYMFSGGMRGRKSGGVEKVVERRQRRMIKNRESAARSRARKQAYTMELEAEVAKLKAENQELRRKQAEIMEMQKNQPQAMEVDDKHGGPKKRLRRTQTGPW